MTDLRVSGRGPGPYFFSCSLSAAWRCPSVDAAMDSDAGKCPRKDRNKSSAKSKVDRKVGRAAVLLSVERAGSPSNTPWPRPTSVPSGILIHPAVWPQYTNVTDRTDGANRTTVYYRIAYGHPKKKSPEQRKIKHGLVLFLIVYQQ